MWVWYFTKKHFCLNKILQVHWLKWLGICCCYGHTLGLRGSINSGWGQFRSFWWQRGRLLRSRRECLDFTTILSSLYAQLPSIWLMLYVRYSTQWTRLLNLEIGLGIWLWESMRKKVQKIQWRSTKSRKGQNFKNLSFYQYSM